MSVQNHGDIKKYLEVNDNEIIPYQNLGNAAKATLRKKFIALNANVRKQGLKKSVI